MGQQGHQDRMISDTLLASIKRHEGWRSKAYQDSEGIWTVGYGRNLQELEISLELGTSWLLEDIKNAEREARNFPEWAYLDSAARKEAFVEMVFNMGTPRVSGFRNTLRAIREQDWDEAAAEMLDSRWARQVGVRARRLAEQMRTGHHWNGQS